MSSHDDFLAKQAKTYDVIRNIGKKVIANGFVADETIGNRRGGITIALFHSPRVAKAFADVSRHVNRLVPAIVYDEPKLHTTLIVGGEDFETPFHFDPEGPKHRRILSILSAAAYQAKRSFDGEYCQIDYPRYLYSDKVVLAEGYPNGGFTKLVNGLADNCKAEGLAVKRPWGAHSTISRFKEARSPQESKDLIHYLDGLTGPGISRVSQIAVGYSDFETDNADGCFKVYKVFYVDESNL